MVLAFGIETIHVLCKIRRILYSRVETIDPIVTATQRTTDTVLIGWTENVNYENFIHLYFTSEDITTQRWMDRYIDGWIYYIEWMDTRDRHII